MSRSTPFRAVAFDLGGVLVDVDHGAPARHLGLPAAAVEAAFFGRGRHDDVTVGVLGGDGFLLAAAAELAVPVEAARMAWRNMVALRPGATTVVDRLSASSGVQLAIWSNTDPEHIAHLRGVFPAALSQATQVVSCEVGAKKPETDFYETALAALGALPSEVLFFDDREENVDSALGLGIAAVRVRTLEEVVRALEERDVIAPLARRPRTD